MELISSVMEMSTSDSTSMGNLKAMGNISGQTVTPIKEPSKTDSSMEMASGARTQMRKLINSILTKATISMTRKMDGDSLNGNPETPIEDAISKMSEKALVK